MKNITVKYTIRNQFNAEVTYKEVDFPGGEKHIVLDLDRLSLYNEDSISFSIFAVLMSHEDVITLGLIFNAIRAEYFNTPINLEVPYMPYARQDRITQVGEPLSIKFMANYINLMCKPDTALVWDPHSNVTEALINNFVNIDRTMLYDDCAPLHGLLRDAKRSNRDIVLVSPDAGAFKKTYLLASHLHTKYNIDCTVVSADKLRDTKTGKIFKTIVNDPMGRLTENSFVLIADDICDGGMTFTELSKAINAITKVHSMNLWVSQGIFSKGVQAVSPYFDNIIASIKFGSDKKSYELNTHDVSI